MLPKNWLTRAINMVINFRASCCDTAGDYYIFSEITSAEVSFIETWIFMACYELKSVSISRLGKLLRCNEISDRPRFSLIPISPSPLRRLGFRSTHKKGIIPKRGKSLWDLSLCKISDNAWFSALHGSRRPALNWQSLRHYCRPLINMYINTIQVCSLCERTVVETAIT